MARRIGTVIGIAACLTAAVALNGCSGEGPATAPSPSVVPEPGRTVAADAPDGTGDLGGMHLAVVVPDDDASETLLTAARTVAEAGGAELEEFRAATPDEAGATAALAEAEAAGSDVVIGLGAGTADAFTYETPQLLSQDFLLIGAQLAEPTGNVTAVIWEGATSRGSTVPADGELDPGGITLERGEEAIAAGLASIRDDTTGIVLHLGG
ncbi:MAG: BMP family ABC transporter substrate-binding protein [Microbacterium sp.]